MNLRLQKLRKLLKEQNLDAILIASLPNIIYFTNFSAFTTIDRDAYLLITKNKQYIFTHGIYKEVVEKQVSHFELISIQRENPIGLAVKKLVAEQKINKLGFEAFDLRVNEYDRLVTFINKKILVPTDLVHQLRLIKTPDEIRSIKDACKLGDKAYSHMLKNLRTGITEKKLAFDLEFFIKNHGADISFPPIVAFGSNASMIHHVPTDTKLKRNSLILMDFGVKLNNYCSDMTRTVFTGIATEKQKEVYEIVLNAQKKAVDTLQSSILNPKSLINAVDIDKTAREYIIANGYPSMPHSLGHGIGLEVHESPRLTMISKDLLKPGMAFSIEPGIYLPDEFGVRIEDLYAIENNELKQLTNSPKNFTEV